MISHTNHLWWHDSKNTIYLYLHMILHTVLDVILHTIHLFTTDFTCDLTHFITACDFTHYWLSHAILHTVDCFACDFTHCFISAFDITLFIFTSHFTPFPFEWLLQTIYIFMCNLHTIYFVFYMWFPHVIPLHKVEAHVGTFFSHVVAYHIITGTKTI